ncbi:MltA-interacting protein precursor [Providencia alcalifaciens]|nr:MltA-interacting protein precursor [Providencia alcalifaciens]
MRAEAAYLYAFKGDNWSLTPGIGIKWDSAKLNRYEFGVTSKESAKSGLERYQPNSSWTPYVELSANYRMTDSWSLFALGRVDKLSNEVKDSPMVNKSYSGIVWSGVTYTF